MTVEKRLRNALRREKRLKVGIKALIKAHFRHVYIGNVDAPDAWKEITKARDDLAEMLCGERGLFESSLAFGFADAKKKMKQKGDWYDPRVKPVTDKGKAAKAKSLRRAKRE